MAAPAASSGVTDGTLPSASRRLTSTIGTPSACSCSSSGCTSVAVAMMKPSTWRERSDSTCDLSRSASLSVLTIQALYPTGLSTCSTPRTIGGNSGLVRSGTIRPIVADRAVFRLRAIGFGRYPSALATFMTRLAVSSLTRFRVSGFSARDAVAGWTPACRATSRSVGGRTGRG